MAETLLTIDEAAQKLGVTADTVLYWIDAFELPSHRIGHLMRFRPVEIDDWLVASAGRCAPTPAWHMSLNPALRRIDSAFFYPALYLDRPLWLQRALQGEFTAIPESIAWGTSAEFALSINGYLLAPALGLGECADFANSRLEEAQRTKCWSGSAIELWICLFFENRRWHHFGHEPSPAERELLDALCRATRTGLLNEQIANVTGG